MKIITQLNPEFQKGLNSEVFSHLRFLELSSIQNSRFN